MKRQRKSYSTVSGQLRKTSQTRRGTWLAQLVITITIMSVLMTISSNALFRMYRQESLMVERTFRTTTWLRLSREFRRDIHVARSVTLSEDGNQLVLISPDSSIIWFINDGDVKRVLRTSGSEADPGALPGERYAFSESTIRFSLQDSDSASAIASIEVTPLPASNGGTPSGNVVVATAGLDHRFHRQNDPSGAQP